MHPRFRDVALATTVGGISLLLLQSISKYGVQGTVNYIWVGDPYPDLRQYLETLDRVESKLTKERSMIDKVEEALQRARLETVDNADDESILRVWEQQIGDLRKEIAFLSDRLDKLAAKIDFIPGIDKASIRSRKRKLSAENVKLMERADALIEFYKKAKAGN